jgi:hypothetical protein
VRHEPSPAEVSVAGLLARERAVEGEERHYQLIKGSIIDA